MKKNVSVLMSVYKNDVPQNLIKAVDSIACQSLPPKQIVMVVDGVVSDEIWTALEELKKKYDFFEVYPLQENVGLGKALNYGSSKCKYDLIARMDSDDIAVHERLEKQCNIFEQDESLSLIGGFAQEFIDSIDNLSGVRKVPEFHDEIVKFMKSRNPFCHMTVMMKKNMLDKAGGYKHWYFAEDYYLWIRMYIAGAKFYNIQEPLCYARINSKTFERRSGMKYYKSIKGLLKLMRKERIISWLKYEKECTKRFVGHILVPNKLKNKMYSKFLRQKQDKEQKNEVIN